MKAIEDTRAQVRSLGDGLKTPQCTALVVARCIAPKSRLFAISPRRNRCRSTEAAAAQAKPSVWLACRRVWRNVARQSKSGSRVAAPIVMIPTLDVESILRTWTPDSPCDIPLKGAQAASRQPSQPSQPSQPTRPAFAGFVGRGEEPSLHACGPLA